MFKLRQEDLKSGRQRQEGKEQHVQSPEDRGQCTPASRKSSVAGWGM